VKTLFRATSGQHRVGHRIDEVAADLWLAVPLFELRERGVDGKVASVADGVDSLAQARDQVAPEAPAAVEARNGAVELPLLVAVPQIVVGEALEDERDAVVAPKPSPGSAVAALLFQFAV
jgi:hypothetical protein